MQVARATASCLLLLSMHQAAVDSHALCAARLSARHCQASTLMASMAVGPAHLQPGSKGLPQVLQRCPVQSGLNCLQPLAMGLDVLQLAALLLSSERLPIP